MFLKGFVKKNSVFSDKTLADNIRSGKDVSESFRFIYREYFVMVRAFILKNGGAIHEAEDVFQEGIMVLVDTIRNDRFQGKSTIKTFLYAVCRNLWLVHLKKNERYLVKDTTDDFNWGVQQETATLIEESGQQSALQMIFDQLGEPCHSILKDFYFNGLDTQELLTKYSDRFSNEQVIRNRKSKCLKMVRKSLSDSPELENSLRERLASLAV